MKHPCTGVILAGGRNTRFSGRDKALVRVGEKRIIDYIFSVFKSLFEEIIIVTNQPLQYLEWDALIVTDIYPIRSSLTGIHAGLFYASTPYAFFTACDTPFIKKELIETVIARIEPGMEAIIPEISVGLEPLCAVYARSSLKRIEQHLAEDKLKIQWVFKKDRIKKISEAEILDKDPQLLSFFNVNSPRELEKAELLASRINQ
jgi:molybdopterin-guanine dinucleotide biosynthesis protein A